MTASAGSDTEPVLSNALSPNVAKGGIPKVFRLERAFNGTLPESSPSLQPSGGTSQGRDNVCLFSNPCWFPFMHLLVSPWTPVNFLNPGMPWQRVAQRNNMLCGFVWNLTFYLNLLSASTIWCFCTDRASNGFLGIPSRTLVILMTCLLRVVSPRWWSLPLQFFHLQSFYSLEWFFSHWEKGDEKMEVNNKHSAWLPSSNQENP